MRNLLGRAAEELKSTLSERRADAEQRGPTKKGKGRSTFWYISDGVILSLPLRLLESDPADRCDMGTIESSADGTAMVPPRCRYSLHDTLHRLG